MNICPKVIKMDWRSILKFDENLYNHTDESTKEKHQKILDFIKVRPKTKGTGLRIKQFLDSGELDDSFTPLDLPRNSITPKTKEFYEGIYDFNDVKDRINHLVTTYSTMIRIFRDEIEAGNGGMPIRDFTMAFSKLVKNFYYSEMPKLNIDMSGIESLSGDRHTHPSMRSMPAYKKAVENYVNRFEGHYFLLHLVNGALEYFLPSYGMSITSSVNIRQGLET